MLLRRFLVEGSGCASYLFGCTTHGRLAVVDPHVDLVNDYIEAAQRAGSPIVEVIDTHVHADHHSGALQLVRRTGARLRLPEGAPVEYEFEPLRDSDVIALANTTAHVISTPGHVEHHASLLVHDARRGDDPWLLFSGDLMFVGDVGRPDLHGRERELAHQLFTSIHERVLTLPDWIELLPSHIGGSKCGAGISSNPSSTIGFERRNNKLLAIADAEAFVDAVLAKQTAAPEAFTAIYEANVRGETVPA